MTWYDSLNCEVDDLRRRISSAWFSATTTRRRRRAPRGRCPLPKSSCTIATTSRPTTATWRSSDWTSRRRSTATCDRCVYLPTTWWSTCCVSPLAGDPHEVNFSYTMQSKLTVGLPVKVGACVKLYLRHEQKNKRTDARNRIWCNLALKYDIWW